MMADAATVFAVRDVASSTAYYRDGLGFSVTFEYGQPTTYVCLCRDNVQIHLMAASQTRRLPGHGEIAVFVADVDGLYGELTGRGVKTLNAPTDRDYGMRNFEVLDPEGNQLAFGMPVKSAAKA